LNFEFKKGQTFGLANLWGKHDANSSAIDVDAREYVEQQRAWSRLLLAESRFRTLELLHKYFLV